MQNELIRTIELCKWLDKPYRLTATPQECKDLAQRLGLIRLDKFQATFDILKASWSLGGFQIQGTLQADLEQECVRTLTPFPISLTEKFSVNIIDVHHKSTDIPDMEDLFVDIEYMDQGMIDIGELAVQYLSLSLDPYPKSQAGL